MEIKTTISCHLTFFVYVFPYFLSLSIKNKYRYITNIFTQLHENKFIYGSIKRNNIE
jgi:hypothetical protein